MTEIPKKQMDSEHLPLQAHDGGRRPDKAERNPNSGLYTENGGCDSMSDLDDVAEDYLRQSIEEVGADLAKRKKNLRVSAQRVDAALIEYVVAYLAAHPDPQPFLRDLQAATSKSGPSARKLEPADA